MDKSIVSFKELCDRQVSWHILRLKLNIMKLPLPLRLFTLVLLVSPSLGTAPSGPWDAFNYAPASKLVWAMDIHSTNGTVDGATGLVNNTGGNATLTGDGSYVALDFGKEVRAFKCHLNSS